MLQLFISDLHLDDERPATTRAFLHFLQQEAQDADHLYILGDFFESWIGDDDSSPLIDTVTAALRDLSASGTELFIMQGNRDFLLGENFCHAVGAKLLADPTVVTLAGEPTLLMHGDSLCTADSEYMAFRQMARSDAWQQEVLAKPLVERRALARQLRPPVGRRTGGRARGDARAARRARPQHLVRRPPGRARGQGRRHGRSRSAVGDD